MTLDQRIEALAVLGGNEAMLDHFSSACERLLRDLRASETGSDPEVVARRRRRYNEVWGRQVGFLLALRVKAIGEMAVTN
jgi:hypothetical protein